MAGLIFASVLAVACSGGTTEVQVAGDEVSMKTDDLDVRFTKTTRLDQTFMLFGGGSLDHGNALSNVTYAALSLDRARPIHRRYPDFHRCKSGGAAMAQQAVEQLDLVPADDPTWSTLRSALDRFEHNLRDGGDRVCVRLTGSGLRLEAAEVREVGEDVSSRMPRQNFFLVTSAHEVDCKNELEG